MIRWKHQLEGTELIWMLGMIAIQYQPDRYDNSDIQGIVTQGIGISISDISMVIDNTIGDINTG